MCIRDRYRPLHLDGIYFQTFTETANTRAGSRSIAALYCEWVNEIAAALLAENPVSYTHLCRRPSYIDGMTVTAAMKTIIQPISDLASINFFSRFTLYAVSLWSDDEADWFMVIGFQATGLSE